MTNKCRSPKSANRGWFPKGRSGNPNGRPTTASRAQSGSVLDIVLNRTLTVSHQGGTREMPLEEALQQQTFRDAVAGNRMARREVLKWIKKREDWLANQQGKTPCKKISLVTSPDPDNADAALMLLGIAAPNPEHVALDGERTHLLLELWAVQAALRRRRGGSRLTDNEREEILRCTCDTDNLRWPRGTGE